MYPPRLRSQPASRAGAECRGGGLPILPPNPPRRGEDPELDLVEDELYRKDPVGDRVARVLRTPWTSCLTVAAPDVGTTHSSIRPKRRTWEPWWRSICTGNSSSMTEHSQITASPELKLTANTLSVLGAGSCPPKSSGVFAWWCGLATMTVAGEWACPYS